MRVPDRRLSDLREHGFLVFEGFLGGEELAAAQEALWLHYPRPEDYFDDPAAHAALVATQFAGNIRGPWRSWNLNRLTFHPDLLDLAERFLGSADLRLYKTELWAKYAGTVDYDQTHHRDFANHSLVVPKRSDPPTQMTTFLLLSDVGEEDGPTKVIPLPMSEDIPYWPNRVPIGALTDREISVTGPAGTLFAYRTDILHRGSRMTADRAARFTLLADYEVWGPRWTGKVAWADRALSRDWTEMIERATPRERSVFGFPSPGDPYWDEQTLADAQARYPQADLAPYRC